MVFDMAVDYGIKVTKPGADISTVSDKDSVFSSKYSTLKIYLEGDISLTTNGSGNGSNSVAHNLGFAPAFLCFRKGTAQFTYLDVSSYANSFIPDPGNYSNWIANNDKLVSYTDDTNFYVQAYGAAASTTYNFRYYILVDLAQSFTGEDGVSPLEDYGIKISQTGYDVKTAKEYQLVYSSRYKALQYYDESYQTYNLTLPAMWASPIATSAQEGVYVDIAHGLGYPPVFLAFFNGKAIPYIDINSSNNPYYEVGGFCDATRVRLSFWRKSTWSSGAYDRKWSAETVTVKVFIFTKDLTAA